MIEIFVSRPTWLSKEYQKGLGNFLSFVETLDLKPRTIGSTDYPTNSPLEEVIRIMDECKGVIILGYPQIIAKEGMVKDEEVKDLLLPTEWNHIEASLAYVKKLPLLIIHHKGVLRRGLFDPGAVSKFIYEKDMTDESWVLSQDIKGALKTWKFEVGKYSSNPKEKKEAEILNVKLISLPEESQKILVHIFENTSESHRHAEAIARTFNMPKERVKYFLDRLYYYDLIRITHGNYIKGESYIGTTEKGRAYVVERDLIK